MCDNGIPGALQGPEITIISSPLFACEVSLGGNALLSVALTMGHEHTTREVATASSHLC